MLEEFDSREDSHSTKFERKPLIFVKLSFRELYHSKLSGLHLRTSKISTPPEIAVGTHFHARHGTKTTPVFLPADGEASWSLLPSSTSLLSLGKDRV